MLQYIFDHYPVYLLVLLRMVAFIGTSPLLSVTNWPALAKIGLAAYMAMTVAPTVGSTVPSPINQAGSYIIMALQESIVGILLGFMATMLFSVLTIAGSVFDLQIGFSSALLYNPGAAMATGLTSNLNSILFTLYFLGVNGLDGLLLAVMNSYHFIPIGHLLWPSHFWIFLVNSLGLAMTLALQMVAPLLVALLLTDITFALLSRAVPQMNVFVVGLPAKLLVGMCLFAGVMPGMVYLFSQIFSSLFTQLNSVLQMVGG